MNTKVLLLLWVVILVSCSEKPKKVQEKVFENKPDNYLPFKSVNLQDLNSFKETSENWKIGGNAYANRNKDQTISTTEGSGVLANLPQEGNKQNLFTNFEHGDIEVEFDVMMPKGSNSGVYFQGRYEVQLFDSWGVDSPQHSDIGGIYQRWDGTREKGKEGFEGFAPKLNAAKAPGLWQHFKILFHAPRFDASGNKIKNAWFEGVWLNGMLVQEDVEVTGPTRAAAFEDEKPMGPLMIQGDHGPVAFKNLTYKVYNGKRVSFADVTMNEYENKDVLLPNLDSLVPIRSIKTDSISALMATGERPQKILRYDGTMNFPIAGEYLFDLKLNGAGGLLLLNKDTIINRNGDYNLDSLGLEKMTLEKGAIPFTFIYNKHRPWTNGFSLEVEGPGIQKHALEAPSSLSSNNGNSLAKIMVEIDDEPIAQRSFLMHNGKKRTHCISVGTPQKIHYAYDLQLGSLLKVWSGDFLDATPMWLSRGPKQLGTPAGFTVSFHGTPAFQQLSSDDAEWPDTISENEGWKQMGYELDTNGIPSFSYELNKSKIIDKMIPSASGRSLKRSIAVNGNQEIWHKVAAGESIEELPDGSFIVNDESYFIDFENGNLNPIIRKTGIADELVVKIPSGKQEIDYSIIW